MKIKWGVFLLLLCITGCAKTMSKTAPIPVTEFESPFEAVCEESVWGGKIFVEVPSVCVELEYPTEVAGLRFESNGQEVTVSYKGLSAICPVDALPKEGPLSTIYESLRLCRVQDYLSEGVLEEDRWRFTGEGETPLTVYTDSTGKIFEIENLQNSFKFRFYADE